MKRSSIVAATRGWLRTPYCHQASLRGVGCDCLGLVRGVWRELYGEEPEEMPAYSADWAESSGIEALAEAGTRHMVPIAAHDFKAGDLLLFRWKLHLPAKHAGIATTRTSMIHAQDGACVAEVALSRWWRQRLAYAYRFPGVDD